MHITVIPLTLATGYLCILGKKIGGLRLMVVWNKQAVVLIFIQYLIYDTTVVRMGPSQETRE